MISGSFRHGLAPSLAPHPCPGRKRRQDRPTDRGSIDLTRKRKTARTKPSGSRAARLRVSPSLMGTYRCGSSARNQQPPGSAWRHRCRFRPGPVAEPRREGKGTASQHGKQGKAEARRSRRKSLARAPRLRLKRIGTLRSGTRNRQRPLHRLTLLPCITMYYKWKKFSLSACPRAAAAV